MIGGSRPLAAALGIVLTCCACRNRPAATEGSRPEVMVAAAANLTDVFGVIGSRFEAETAVHPVFSFASTAQLTLQIENGAPFDVFAAADAIHVEELDHKGLLAAGSRAVYALGVLALWIPPGGPPAISTLADLTRPEVRFVAIAKPELAPYGQAAMESLVRMGIWTRIQPKVVYAENINVAKQYGTSHNADAVLTAYSLVLNEAGKVVPVDEQLHQPIQQELAILGSAKHPDGAQRFVSFLLTGNGRDLLAQHGYTVSSAGGVDTAGRGRSAPENRR